MNPKITSSDIDTKKLIEHLFETNRRASVLDALVLCILLDEKELSPTDIQERIYKRRRGGSVDGSLARMIEQGWITLTDVTQHMGSRRRVNWTLAGLDFLKSIKRREE